MRVGIYIDGYNLYFGGRGICGRGTSGWRWLDPRQLATTVVARESGWPTPLSYRVVYCTARISGRDNPGGQRDQDVYLRALRRSGAVDCIEYGYYQSKVVRAPLARWDRRSRPELVRSDWPVMIKDAAGNDVPDATFMVSVARREEKGSDVNVATHLLVDVLSGAVDAAVVVSNDSDLALPVRSVRDRVPCGTVNPTAGYPAGALNGDPTDGVGGHWWYRLVATDFLSAQLPDPTIGVARPLGW